MADAAVIEGVAGAVAACIALTSTYPLLTVSTLRALELKDGPTSSQLGGKLRLLPRPARDVIEFTREHSWRALFAGLRPAVAATAVSQGVYFTAYSWLRQLAVARQLSALQQAGSTADPKGVGISVGSSLLVASVAGCINVLLTNPLWVVITQLQALHRHTRSGGGGTLAVARQVWQEQGLAGFFQGLMPSLVMVVNPTIQFILYEGLVSRALDWRRGRRAAHTQQQRRAPGRPGSTGGARAPAGLPLSALDIFVLSALAKIGATLVTYPLLVVKSRLQAINTHSPDEMRYEGVVHAVRSMWQREGCAAFYKGMQVKLLQTVLAAALLMSIKEEVYSLTRSLLAPAPRLKGRP